MYVSAERVSPKQHCGGPNWSRGPACLGGRLAQWQVRSVFSPGPTALSVVLTGHYSLFWTQIPHGKGALKAFFDKSNKNGGHVYSPGYLGG